MSAERYWIPVAVDTGDGMTLFWDEASGMMSWYDEAYGILGFDEAPDCAGELEALPGFEVLPGSPWIRRTISFVDRGLEALKAMHHEMGGWSEEDFTAFNVWQLIGKAIREAESK